MRHVLFALVLFLLSACEAAPWRDQPPPWGEASVAGAADAQAVRKDGEVVVLGRPRIEQRHGAQWLVGDVDGSERCLLLDDLQALATRRVEALRVVANVAIAIVVVGVVVVAATCSHGHGGCGNPLSGLSFGVEAPRRECDGKEARPTRKPLLRSEHPASGRVR